MKRRTSPSVSVDLDEGYITTCWSHPHVWSGPHTGEEDSRKLIRMTRTPRGSATEISPQSQTQKTGIYQLGETETSPELLKLFFLLFRKRQTRHGQFFLNLPQRHQHLPNYQRKIKAHSEMQRERASKRASRQAWWSCTSLHAHKPIHQELS